MTLGPTRVTSLRWLHTIPQSFDEEQDKGGGGENPPNPPKPQKPEGLTKEIETFYSGIIAKEVGDAVRKAQADFEEKQRKTKEKLDADAEKRKQEEAGEYEKVKTTLTSERDTALTRAESAEQERDALATYFEAQYSAALSELPDDLLLFKPADDASFAEKSKWLSTAQEAVKKRGDDDKKPPKRGNGPDFPPKARDRDSADEVKRRQRQQQGYRAF